MPWQDARCSQLAHKIQGCARARSGRRDTQARPKTRHAMLCYSRPRHTMQCYLLCFPVNAIFMLYMFYDIHRDEAHKPRGRASDVSTISTCVSLYVIIYCPLPHPISVRTGWRYHCCVLVWLLALFAKLNRFFRKKLWYRDVLAYCINRRTVT